MPSPKEVSATCIYNRYTNCERVISLTFAFLGVLSSVLLTPDPLHAPLHRLLPAGVAGITLWEDQRMNTSNKSTPVRVVCCYNCILAGTLPPSSCTRLLNCDI